MLFHKTVIPQSDSNVLSRSKSRTLVFAISARIVRQVNQMSHGGAAASAPAAAHRSRVPGLAAASIAMGATAASVSRCLCATSRQCWG